MEIKVYLDAMGRYADASDDLSEGFTAARRLLVDADVTADSFGLLQESGDIAKTYEQRCNDGLDVLNCGVDVFSDLASGLRQMRDNYNSSDQASAQRSRSVR